MNRRRVIILLGLVIILVAAASWYRSNGFDGTTATRTSQSKNAKTGGDAAVPVTTTPAQIEDFAIRRRTIGIIESLATVVVKSRIESQVTDQHVRDGQIVNKGDLLFTLDDREVRATIARNEAQLAQDEATVLRTQTDLDRYERLSETDAVSRQRLDQAIADNKIAQASVAADRAQLRSDNLQLNYTKIEAPIGGRIGAIRVTPGNLVSVNDPTGLVTITQIQPIRIAFTLAERDLAALRKASAAAKPAAVRAYSPSASQPLATGELDFVDSAVDPTSGTIAAKARFENKNMELWPGMYVDVEIDLDVRPSTVMIPTVAIQSGQKGPFVFVRLDQKVEMRRIELVGVEGNRTALVSGVDRDELVIVEGQMRLTDGARVVEAAPPAGNPSTGDVTGRSPAGRAEAKR